MGYFFHINSNFWSLSNLNLVDYFSQGRFSISRGRGENLLLVLRFATGFHNFFSISQIQHQCVYINFLYLDLESGNQKNLVTNFLLDFIIRINLPLKIQPKEFLEKISGLISGFGANLNTFLAQIDMLSMEQELDQYTARTQKLERREEWRKLVKELRGIKQNDKIDRQMIEKLIN